MKDLKFIIKLVLAFFIANILGQLTGILIAHLFIF